MSEGADAELHGDLKTFVVGSFGYPVVDLPGLPEQPPVIGSGSGVADLRLKLTLRGVGWRAEVHHSASMLSGSSGGLTSGSSTGVGLTAPELVDLTWEPELGDGLTVRGRVDRLLFAAQLPHLSVTLGRQPIAFGTGLVFAPLDLVNPFSPATIDSEYRPGVDAARADAYAGVSSRLSVVAAWSGAAPPYSEDAAPIGWTDAVVAADGQFTVGVTDVQGFVGLARGDRVVGGAVASSVGPVGVHADATLTFPDPQLEDTEPFVRAVAGGEVRPTGKTTVAVEGYLQTFGEGDPSEYLAAFGDPRFARGEVWLLGRAYAALSVAQELTPLVNASAAVIANLEDPSALIAPSIGWSLADDASLALGGFVGAGPRPDPVSIESPALTPNSEFGLYPHALYLSMRAYF